MAALALRDADERRKEVEDLVHKAGELAQRWDQRLTRSNLRLVQRYLDG